MDAWSSSAMTLALIGAAFTRQPMINAMSAAGAAMKAFQQKDKENFDREYKKWQTSNENALRANEYQLQAHRALIQEYERALQLKETERDHAVNEVTKQAATYLRGIGLEEQAERVEIGGMSAFVGMTDKLEGLQSTISRAAPQIDKYLEAQQAIDELKQTPGYINATPIQRYQQEWQIWKGKDPEAADYVTSKAKVTRQAVMDRKAFLQSAMLDASRGMSQIQTQMQNDPKAANDPNLKNNYAQYRQQYDALNSEMTRLTAYENDKINPFLDEQPSSSTHAAPPSQRLKPIPPSTLAQWPHVLKENKDAARKSLADQGYDTSALQ
jgi:hypothetical protein